MANVKQGLTNCLFTPIFRYMKKSKDLYLESMFVTEDDKKKFENFNRVMAQKPQGPQPNKNQKKK